MMHVSWLSCLKIARIYWNRIPHMRYYKEKKLGIICNCSLFIQHEKCFIIKL